MSSSTLYRELLPDTESENGMHIEQRFGVASGRPSLWRIRYYDIRPDGFSWVADVSMDEGATWHRGYLRIQARRIGPGRSLEPLAPPRPGDR